MARFTPIRFLVLAHFGDDTALQVAASLAKRHGNDCVRLVSGEELVMAPRWTHQLNGQQVQSEIQLADGTCLSAGGFSAVLNRLRAVPMPHFAEAKEADRDYAVMEMYALMLSWLHSLPCPVFNRANGRGLGGAERTLSEWLALAAEAGLPTRDYCFVSDPRRFSRKDMAPHAPRGGSEAPEPDSTRAAAVQIRQPLCYLEPLSSRAESIVIAGQHLSVSVPAEMMRGLDALRKRSGCDLLQVDFARVERTGAYKVVRVTPFPEAQSAADILAIVSLLESAVATVAACI